MSIQTIKQRYQFVLSHKASEQIEGNLLVFQKLNRKDNLNSIFFGFTVTKKIGMAFLRNKIKRRLRFIVRLLIKNEKKYFEKGHNYVLISKPRIINAKFEEIKKEMICNFLKFKENN